MLPRLVVIYPINFTQLPYTVLFIFFVLACWFFISQHVTNVKGLHVDLMQPVMPQENAPAIKVSKEMDSGVMVGGTLKIFR